MKSKAMGVIALALGLGKEIELKRQEGGREEVKGGGEKEGVSEGEKIG